MNGEIYECGDGVPTSIIVPTTQPVGGLATAEPPQIDAAADAEVRRPARHGASIALTVLGQLLITGLIALGGDPVLGVVAAVAIVICSLALIAAEAAGLQL